MEIKVYTDGSCNAKTGEGGAGVYGKIFNDDGSVEEFRFHNGFVGTKTGRMEITAMIYALNILDHTLVSKKDCPVQIFSDSQYVINSITLGWARAWKLSNYVGKANGDLWDKLLDSLDRFQVGSVSFFWVKGHNGNPGNEEADKEAREGYKEACAGRGEVDIEEDVVVAFFRCRCLEKPEKIRESVDMYLEENLTSSGCHKGCGTKEWLITDKSGKIIG